MISRDFLFYNEQNYKPGSVSDSHLSRMTIADHLKPQFAQPSKLSCSLVLLQVGFTRPISCQIAGELLPRLFTLTVIIRR